MLCQGTKPETKEDLYLLLLYITQSHRKWGFVRKNRNRDSARKLNKQYFFVI